MFFKIQFNGKVEIERRNMKGHLKYATGLNKILKTKGDSIEWHSYEDSQTRYHLTQQHRN
jgi:hypothetical protein